MAKQIIPLFILLIIGLFEIGSQTSKGEVLEHWTAFLTPECVAQLRFIAVGAFAYWIFSSIDDRTLRKFAWPIYIGTCLLLLGLFFVPSSHHVHRWYRFPLLSMTLQPSEFAKISLIIFLARYLDEKRELLHQPFQIFLCSLFILVPFILIVKEPDLGTGLVLLPTALGMLYLAGAPAKFVRWASYLSLAGLAFILMIFLGVFSFEEARPLMTKVMKEYQYERLNPNTYHQGASQRAIALGHWVGEGVGEGDFARKGWLPFAQTDSIFPACCEETGLLGGITILGLFFSLIYFGFQVTAVARDHFGRLVACGIAIHLSVHVLLNVGMMCGLLPITGVPLLLMSYGGSSTLATMMALGILQGIYQRRFTF